MNRMTNLDTNKYVIIKFVAAVYLKKNYIFEKNLLCIYFDPNYTIGPNLAKIRLSVWMLWRKSLHITVFLMFF